MNGQFSQNPTPLVGISTPLFEKYEINVWIKRDDLNHSSIQGNKWHKLKLNLEEAKRQQKNTLITFGGAYSNHIAATAAAATEQGFNSIGFIRGDELAQQPTKWSPTLKKASELGMSLRFLTRQDYRRKSKSDFLDSLILEFPDGYILPEGGSNELAVQGFNSLMNEIESQLPQWTHLYTAVGTGGTLAGLVRNSKLKPNRTILGVAVLKRAEYLVPQIETWIGAQEHNQWNLLTEFHDGGYGKLSKKLNQFKMEFEQQFQVPLDPIYTIKMVNAFYQQVQLGLIPRGSNIVLLHTGGLQGNCN
ncbi:MAG TPA: pyridoxal-phosphate dependent enzyme [Thiomicrospira sp.]|nr:pyridoxal-phosphate dependent enzyme [Thiomicrospira sp.]